MNDGSDALLPVLHPRQANLLKVAFELHAQRQDHVTAFDVATASEEQRDYATQTLADLAALGFLSREMRKGRCYFYIPADRAYRWIARFQPALLALVASTTAPTPTPIRRSVAQPHPVELRLAQLVDQLRSAGIGLPVRTSGFATPLIARQIDVGPKHWRTLSNLLPAIAKDIGTVPAHTYVELCAKSGISAIADQSVAAPNATDCLSWTKPPKGILTSMESALRSYLERLEDTGGFIPENVRALGKPSYNAIYTAAGIPSQYKTHPETVALLEAIVDATASRLGIGQDRYRSAADIAGDLTYAAAAALSTQITEVSSESGQRRLRATLRKFADHLGRGQDDLVGTELLADFEHVRDRIAAEIPNSDTRRHFMIDAQRWHGLLANRTAAGTQTFSAALNFLLRRDRYRTVGALADAIGMQEDTLSTWVKGHNEPYASDCHVGRLEDLFCVGRGFLSQRIGSAKVHWFGSKIRGIAWPKEIDEDWRKKKLISAILPAGFVGMKADDQQALITALVADLDSQIPYRQAQKTRVPYRLPTLPDPLQAEWDHFCAHKLALRPADGLQRNERWTSEKTKLITSDAFRTFFSALAMDRAKGGLGVPHSDLTMALLAFEGVVDWFITWMKRHDPRAPLHSGITNFVSNVCALLRPETGYVWQRFDLAARLHEIPGVLSAQTIAAAITSREAWRARCAEAWASNKKLADEADEEMGFSRDPFAPILPILEHDRPLDLLQGALNAAYARLPKRGIATDAERAVALRNLLICVVTKELTLRRKNVWQLDWRPDNRGRLSRHHGRYLVVIPRKEFKNATSSFFGRDRKSDYVAWLPADVTPLFDEYLGQGSFSGSPGVRDILIKDGAQMKQADRRKPAVHELWVSRTGSRISDLTLSVIMFDFTWTHLAHHPVIACGIPGVEAFGMHAVRHIVATHLVKVTNGNFALAAAQLQDTPETIERRYARFLAGDKTAMARRVLDETRGKPAWA